MKPPTPLADTPESPRLPPCQFTSRWWFLWFGVIAVLTAIAAPFIRAWPAEKITVFLWIVGPAAMLGVVFATFVEGERQRNLRVSAAPIATWRQPFRVGIIVTLGSAGWTLLWFLSFDYSTKQLPLYASGCGMFLLLTLANLHSFVRTTLVSERGIALVPGPFLRWEQIASYVRDERRHSRLWLSLNDGKRCAIDVPSQHAARGTRPRNAERATWA